MNSDIVIRAENLGKKYVIGHQSTDRATTFRDVIARNTHNLARTARDLIHGKPLISGDEVEEFSALQDINFEIHRGDVVGIIGRNGAGKSTLLKVLSRITEPSEGRVEIRGRVASLLEVGTGFHPELTGRENIFLNGAILGMGHSEIRRKFDEIVTFSEVEKFLDTPVKRYSSGMYVRLAFAVAAHLEPEILIVDEVLAVGDAEFQKKCLGKMQDVAGQGRTVLFVSHNLGSIAALCNRGLVLHEGRLALDAEVGVAISHYAAQVPRVMDYVAPPNSATRPVHFVTARVAHEGNSLMIEAQIANDRERALIINARVRDAVGAPLGMASLGGFDPDQMLQLVAGQNRLNIQVEVPDLANGDYFVDLDIEEPYGHFLDRVNDRLSFEVLRTPTHAHGRVLRLDWGVGPIELTAAGGARV